MTAPQVAEAVFDSHRFVKRLTEAGMERGLAEVLAEEHMGPWIRNVATKTDVESFRREAATKADTELVRRDLAHGTEANIRRDVATKADRRVEAVREDLANFRANDAPQGISRTSVPTWPPRRISSLRTDMVSKENLAHTVRAWSSWTGETDRRLFNSAADLIKWMFGALMAQAALVVAMIKLFS